MWQAKVTSWTVFLFIVKKSQNSSLIWKKKGLIEEAEGSLKSLEKLLKISELSMKEEVVCQQAWWNFFEPVWSWVQAHPQQTIMIGSVVSFIFTRRRFCAKC